MNISEAILRHAASKPTHPALIQGDTVITYSQLSVLVSQAATRIAANNVKPGDIVAICLGETIAHVIAIYAAARCGAAILPMDVRWTLSEREHIANFFGATLALHEPGQTVPGIPASVIVDATWLQIQIHASTTSFPVINESDPLLLSLSTGTTGIPKGPMLTHKQMIARFITQKESLTFRPDDRYLSATPLYFGAGRGFVMGMIHNGATVILLAPPYSPGNLLDAISDYQINVTLLVPTMLRRLLDFVGADLHSLKSLRLLLSTGAILHPDERESITHHLCPYLMNYYGSTEGGGISVLRWDDGDEKADSVGRPVYGTQVQVVDTGDNPVPVGQTGLIRYRGPSVADGFFRYSGSGGAAFKSGWFYPGDLGCLDKDGFLFLMGRAKDTIIRGGVNIYPAEIEEVLVTHRDIVDAAVVGWESRIKGEEIAAFVVPTDGVTIDSKALLEYCSDFLAPYKIPKGIFVLEALPKNSVGKVKKADLVAKLPPTN